MPGPADDRLRFTLDYADDYRFFAAVIENFGDSIVSASDRDIIERVLARDLYKINADKAREYWANFGQHVEKESRQ